MNYRAALARAILACFLILLFWACQPEAGAVQPPQRSGPCRGYDPTRQGQVGALIRCSWERFDPGHGGPAKALSVARCESALDPWADGGSVAGLFQHQHRYWPGRYATLVRAFPLRRSWGLSPSIWSARTQAIVSAIMVRRGGWGPWTCA